MKYCVSARQPDSIKKESNEVFLNWNDKDILPDLILLFPHLKINLHIPSGTIPNLKKIQGYIQEGAKITLVLDDLSLSPECIAYSIPFYWSQKIKTYSEIRALKELGVSQFLLDAPLYFDLESVYKFEIPIRLVANLAYDSSIIPVGEGRKGTYIRPEDIQYYEKYVKTIEFFSTNLKQEEILFDIYKNKQHWPGNLTKIINNLKSPVDNRALPAEFAAARMCCRQNCMRNGTCKFCDTAFIFCKTLDKEKLNWTE